MINITKEIHAICYYDDEYNIILRLNGNTYYYKDLLKAMSNARRKNYLNGLYYDGITTRKIKNKDLMSKTLKRGIKE